MAAPTKRACCRPAATPPTDWWRSTWRGSPKRPAARLSAVLFGALAGSGALPFQRTAFEAAIRRGGVGVGSSVTAFAAGFEAASGGESRDPAAATPAASARAAPSPAQDLLRAAERDYPAEVLPVIAAGIERLSDYQDAAYARRLSRPPRAVRRHRAASMATAPIGCSTRPRASSRSPWRTRTRSASPS